MVQLRKLRLGPKYAWPVRGGGWPVSSLLILPVHLARPEPWSLTLGAAHLGVGVWKMPSVQWCWLLPLL